VTAPATILLVVLLAAAQLKAPPVIPSEHGTVVASTTNGELRWTADWTMSPSSVGAKSAVHFTESGHGHYSPFTQEVRWSLDSTWLADGTFFPFQFEKTIRDVQGRTLAVEKKVFNRDTGKVTFERRDEKGATVSSSFAAASDILTIEGIAGILQFFPFASSGPQGSISGHMLSNEPKLYDVSLESRGSERLKTRTGELNCYKLELVPHLGVLNVFKPLYPKTYFWFNSAPPHLWVRYQGLENGPGSPEIVMEAR
jgi:hypothetical protein